MQPDFSDLLPPSIERLPHFMSALEATRRHCTPDQWRDAVRRSRPLRRWRHFLALDPYTRWGLVKPAGYAGDATLMDFAYRHPSVAAHLAECGEIGRAIYAQTSAAAQSASARQRIDLARDLLAAGVSARESAVISVASGHARELEGLPDSVRARIRQFVAVDNDPAALAVAAGSASGLPFVSLRSNVIKDDASDWARAEIVYSLGLFDYLDDATAVAVLVKMFELTVDHGVCLVANLAHDAANLGYCEAVMDWWMVTRGEQEMRALADAVAAASGRLLRHEVERVGCFWYLKLLPGTSPRPRGRFGAAVEGVQTAPV